MPLTLIPGLALVLAPVFGVVAVSRAGEAAVSPDVLDELEQTICIAEKNWAGSLEEHARQHRVPIDAVAGQDVGDPRRREALQQKLDAVLDASQKSLVAWLRQQLEESQQRYRSLVGHELDLSLCGEAARRMERREAWEKRRREAEMQHQADLLAATDASMLGAACRELAVMKGPPAEAGSSFRDGDVQYWQAQAKDNYHRLSRSYQARTGKPFDPGRCPK